MNIACPSFASDSETGISSIPEPSSCDARAARLNGAGALSGTIELALSGDVDDLLKSALASRWSKSVLTGAREGRVRVAPFPGAVDEGACTERS